MIYSVYYTQLSCKFQSSGLGSRASISCGEELTIPVEVVNLQLNNAHLFNFEGKRCSCFYSVARRAKEDHRSV